MAEITMKYKGAEVLRGQNVSSHAFREATPGTIASSQRWFPTCCIGRRTTVAPILSRLQLPLLPRGFSDMFHGDIFQVYECQT